MTLNYVTLSQDRRHMIITAADGRRARCRSARRGGFTDDDIRRAATTELTSPDQSGQVNRCRRIPVGRHVLYLHVNTGPPMWWLPRLEVSTSRVMIGWLKGMFAIKVDSR